MSSDLQVKFDTALGEGKNVQVEIEKEKDKANAKAFKLAAMLEKLLQENASNNA